MGRDRRSKLWFCAGVLAFAGQDGEPPRPVSSRIEVRVDARIELFTLVARLAGFEEYDQRNSKSRYSREIEESFGDLREHPAVLHLRALRESHGIGFDAVPSLAFHVDEDLLERIPFDQHPERLDARWPVDEARGFLSELLDFVIESGFEDFFAAHRPFYDQVEERLRAEVAKSTALPWFDTFFGERSSARYTMIPGLLCGGGNYGMGIRFPDGRPEEISPVFGCSRFDSDGIPEFSGLEGLFVHELCHTYTNPLVDRFAEALQPAAERIFPHVEDIMRRQAYGNWRSMMYESLVRACVVRCLGATAGPQAGEKQAAEESARGFTWAERLARSFDEYEADRATYPTFDRFFSRVVEFFEAEARRIDGER